MFQVDEWSYLVNTNCGMYSVLGERNVICANIFQMVTTFPNAFPESMPFPWCFDIRASQEQICAEPGCFNNKYCGVHICFKCKKFVESCRTSYFCFVLCRRLEIMDKNGMYKRVLERGGVCWMCHNLAICHTCLAISRPRKEILSLRTLIRNRIGPVRSFGFDFWTCPCCQARLENENSTELSFADQVFLIFEKLSGPTFPVKLTTEFTLHGEIFLSQAELLGLVIAFGGAMFLQQSGADLIRCYRALTTVLGKFFRTTDIRRLKVILKDQFLPLEWHLPPAVKKLDKLSPALLIKKLHGRIHRRHMQQLKTRTFRRSFKQTANIDAPTVESHLDLTWSSEIQV